MLNFVTISSSIIEAGRRILKFARYGADDIQTSDEVSPAGIDSNPIPKLIAVYGTTSTKGETVIIGYLNPNQLADVGEIRTFSTDENGNIKTYTWLKNDGTIELGGNSDNLLRFSKTKEVVDEIQNDIAALKQAFTAWVVTPNDGGGALKAASATWAAQALQKNIDNAKIDKIKTA